MPTPCRYEFLLKRYKQHFAIYGVYVLYIFSFIERFLLRQTSRPLLSNKMYRTICLEYWSRSPVLSLYMTSSAVLCLSYVPSHQMDYRACEFYFLSFNSANVVMAQVEDLRAKDNIPMIVGGTHYYIEALLWNTLLEHTGTQAGDEKPQQQPAGDDATQQLEKLSNAELYAVLESLDPEFAVTLHPNDRRKVLRFDFSEIFLFRDYIKLSNCCSSFLSATSFFILLEIASCLQFNTDLPVTWRPKKRVASSPMERCLRCTSWFSCEWVAALWSASRLHILAQLRSTGFAYYNL